MNLHEAELVLDARAQLGEGPIWDERHQLLRWVDVHTGAVHATGPDGADAYVLVGQPIGAIGLTDDARLIAALRDGIGLLDLATQRVEWLSDVERERADTRMNDAACDPGGRFLAGTMHVNGEPGHGSLYRFDGAATDTVWRGLGISNGIGWSPEGERMYYVDSLAEGIDVCAYDVATGAIGERRRFAAIPVAEGLPDGLTVDAAGNVFVALWGGWEVRRYDPCGRLTARIPLPVEHVTSCCFGGAALDTLYVTTAWMTLDRDERRRQPHAGGIFAISGAGHGRRADRFPLRHLPPLETM